MPSDTLPAAVAMPLRGRPHVVILGGGFGGLAAAKALRRAPVDVTLIDQRNHHLFQPLLYQVATAALNPSDIAVPIRQILRRQRNASVLLAEAVAVDPIGKRVLLSDGVNPEGAVPYDFLILATGVTHSYFGHPEWAGAAPGLKTIEDALEIRKRILLAFESAEWETDPARQRAWLTFILVGGGPTGVELAGAIAEIARHVMTRDFRRIDPAKARVLLIEAGPRILPGFAPELSQWATEAISRLGVEVFTGNPVTALDNGGVTVHGEKIEARTILWAAGVEGSPLASSLGAPLASGGRIPVQPDLSLTEAPGVFVIGDLASLHQDGQPLPALAPVAVQEGRHAARNILRALQGLPGLPFTYHSRGMLATIGRAAAVGEVARLRFTGFAAWLFWLLVHIAWLIGFRNRFLVLTEWAWTYLRYERGARLITGPKQGGLPDRPSGTKG
ncbi:MAG: NAD(P)/FAD-dependent oxidoreductase [Geothrix sp.]